MSEDIEEQRKREIQERTGWCSDYKVDVPPEHTARQNAPVPEQEPPLFRCEMKSAGFYVQQAFPQSVSPGVALGLTFDTLQSLGKKKVKMVRVYFDE